MEFSKLNLFDLIFEATRKCNMKCKHCLRGDAQNVDIDFRWIDETLKYINSVDTITFSGGEPSLNVDAIAYTLKRVKELNIAVNGFFIATNGKSISDEFMHTILDWYLYCCECWGSNELCEVTISLDEYHEKSDAVQRNLDKLKSFAFVTERKVSSVIVDEGRAHNLRVAKHNINLHDNLYCELGNGILTLINGSLYISANGEVREECDTAYDNCQYTIGNLNNSSLIEIVHKGLDFDLINTNQNAKLCKIFD